MECKDAVKSPMQLFLDSPTLQFAFGIFVTAIIGVLILVRSTSVKKFKKAMIKAKLLRRDTEAISFAVKAVVYVFGALKSVKVKGKALAAYFQILVSHLSVHTLLCVRC